MKMFFLLAALSLSAASFGADHKCSPQDAYSVAFNMVVAQNGQYHDPMSIELRDSKNFGLTEDGKTYLIVFRDWRSARDQAGNYPPDNGKYDMFRSVKISASNCAFAGIGGSECKYIKDDAQLAKDQNSPWHSDSIERRAIKQICK